jgi:hypothetical protein
MRVGGRNQREKKGEYGKEKERIRESGVEKGEKKSGFGQTREKADGRRGERTGREKTE